MLFNVSFGANNSGSSTIRSRAALKFGKRTVILRGVFDFIQSVNIAELTVRVVSTVSVILLGDLGEMVSV